MYLFFLLLSLAHAGGIENLVTNGTSVYFRAVQDYHLRSPGTPEITPAVQDVSSDLQIIATAPYGERYCGFGGSSCFLAAACQASFAIEGPGVNVTGSRRQTLIRLDRGGKVAWIEQTSACVGLGQTAPEPLLGLYAVDGMRQIAAAGPYRIADRRSGLRMITTQSEVLVSRDGQLSLLGAAGARALRNRLPFVEAAVDATGENVAYRDGAGTLHWVDVRNGVDEQLAFLGERPVLTDAGDALLYLADGQLRVYERRGGGTRMIMQNVEGFALGEGAGFAATRSNELVRFHLSSNDTEIYYGPFPSIRSVSVNTSVDSRACPLICYGPPTLLLSLTPGGLLVLEGDGFETTDWTVRYEDKTLPFLGKTPYVAWFQIPEDAPTGCCRSLTLASPARDTVLQTQVLPGSVTCFSTWHEAFDRLVTADDPAHVQEVVHVLLTGWSAEATFLPQTEIEMLSLVAYPYAVGLQQLDLRILAPLRPDQRRLFDQSKNCEPPVAR